MTRIPRSQMAIMAECPQLDGEPTDAYLAFTRWIQGGCPAVTRDPEHIWASRWYWRDRYEASRYVAEGEALAAQATAHLVTGDEASDLALDACRRVLARLIAAERAADPEAPFSPGMARDLATTAKTLLEVERLKRGESTANVSVAVRTIPDEVLDLLTPEQLKALKARRSSGR